ncbi:hypothetical protein DCM91_06815 [Chitinophaga costaii]|nr:hypothetical protein DCM91_06815 [Chitinophaga costaii]
MLKVKERFQANHLIFSFCIVHIRLALSQVQPQNNNVYRSFLTGPNPIKKAHCKKLQWAYFIH